MPVEMRESKEMRSKEVSDWMGRKRERERENRRRKPEVLSGELDESRRNAWLRDELAFSEDAELSGE